MLNPSTADETGPDPTVRRCLNYAMAWGYARLVVVNLFALRSTDPTALYGHNDPVGRENDQHIERAVWEAERVVCAWGVHGHLDGRGHAVERLIRASGATPYVFKFNLDGSPVHPLYQPSKAKAMPWPIKRHSAAPNAPSVGA